MCTSFPLRDLERLDDLVVRHRPVLELADLFEADRPVVLLVHEVEPQPVLVDGGVEADGHVDEPERDRPGPERAGCALTRHVLGIAVLGRPETPGVRWDPFSGDRIRRLSTSKG